MESNFLIKKIIFTKIKKSIFILKEFFSFILDKRLKKVIKIKDKDTNKKIKIYDFGYVTRCRASTFFTKEPETINWIKNFNKGDIFLDVGANIGIYSLYAANRGINTISVEPDALNNALLNLNINANLFGKKVLAFALALHDKPKYSTLNIKQIQWGGALNSFDNCRDFLNKTYMPSHRQGVFGDTMDNFLNQLGKDVSHIKIDVDGNEFLVLKGGIKTLASKSLKTILVELDLNHPNYKESIDLIISNGFELSNQFNLDINKNKNFKKPINHIFFRKIK